MVIRCQAVARYESVDLLTQTFVHPIETLSATGNDDTIPLLRERQGDFSRAVTSADDEHGLISVVPWIIERVAHLVLQFGLYLDLFVSLTNPFCQLSGIAVLADGQYHIRCSVDIRRGRDHEVPFVVGHPGHCFPVLYLEALHSNVLVPLLQDVLTAALVKADIAAQRDIGREGHHMFPMVILCLDGVGQDTFFEDKVVEVLVEFIIVVSTSSSADACRASANDDDLVLGLCHTRCP